jgi:DNA-directed RNA polymerase subunit beta'
MRLVKDENGQTLVVNKNGFIVVYDKEKAQQAEANARERAKQEAAIIGTYYNQDYDYWSDAVKEAELDRYVVEVGAVLFKKDGDKVKANEKIAEWDSYQLPIIAEEDGYVELS